MIQSHHPTSPEKYRLECAVNNQIEQLRKERDAALAELAALKRKMAKPYCTHPWDEKSLCVKCGVSYDVWWKYREKCPVTG